VPTLTHLTTLLHTQFLADVYPYAYQDSPAHPIPRRCSPLCISRLSPAHTIPCRCLLLRISRLSCTPHSLQMPNLTHLMKHLHTQFLADVYPYAYQDSPAHPIPCRCLLSRITTLLHTHFLQVYTLTHQTPVYATLPKQFQTQKPTHLQPLITRHPQQCMVPHGRRRAYRWPAVVMVYIVTI